MQKKKRLKTRKVPKPSRDVLGPVALLFALWGLLSTLMKQDLSLRKGREMRKEKKEKKERKDETKLLVSILFNILSFFSSMLANIPGSEMAFHSLAGKSKTAFLISSNNLSGSRW